MPTQLTQLIFPIVLVAAFWFLIIRPQQQRAKQQALMLSRLVTGAEILTIGGIYGTIVEVGDDRLRIAIADGSEMEIVPRSVQTVVSTAADAAEPDEAEAAELGESTDESEPTVGDAAEGDA